MPHMTKFAQHEFRLKFPHTRALNSIHIEFYCQYPIRSATETPNADFKTPYFRWFKISGKHNVLQYTNQYTNSLELTASSRRTKTRRFRWIELKQKEIKGVWKKPAPFFFVFFSRRGGQYANFPVALSIAYSFRWEVHSLLSFHGLQNRGFCVSQGVPEGRSRP